MQLLQPDGEMGIHLLEFGQTVEHRMGRGVERAASGVGSGVKPLGRGFRAIDEGLGFDHGGAHRQRRGKKEKSFHGWVLPSGGS